MISRRLRIPLAGAALLHAALFGIFGARTQSFRVVHLQHHADVEVSLEQEEGSTRSPTAPMQADPITSSTHPQPPLAPVAKVDPPTKLEPTSHDQTPGSEGVPAQREQNAGPEVTPFHFSALTQGAQRDAVGLGSTAAARETSGNQTAREGQDVGALKQALLAHDVEHGQGNLGSISTAVDAVLRESNAPEGTATFVFDIPVVGDVKAWMHHASSGDAEFKKLEQALARRVRNTKFKPSGQGTRVTVTVKVWQQFVDGTKPQDLGSRAEYSLGEATVTKDGTIALSKPPGVILSTRGKLGGVGVYVGPMGVGITGGVSLENIGSPSRRMVSSNVTSAVPM